MINLPHDELAFSSALAGVQCFLLFLCCSLLFCFILSRLSSVVFFLEESSFVACVFASFCGSMEKLQSNVVCVCD